MTKNEYFEKLHEKLSSELGISKDAIVTIRSFALGYKKSRGQIIMWVKSKLSARKVTQQQREHECIFCKHLIDIKTDPGKKALKYQEIIGFMDRADEQLWKDITYPYKFAE